MAKTKALKRPVQQNAHRGYRRQAPTDRRRLVFIAAAVAVVAVVGLIIAGGALRDSNKVSHEAPAEGFVLGSPDAPVTIMAWEDFQCPICKAANASVLKQVEQDYVTAGKAKILFRQFPFLGQESIWAAEASQCAADQGKFWDYHDALFNAQGAENSGALSKANLKRIAGDTGLDLTAFNTCFDSGAHQASVQAEKQEGAQLGISGTPTIFVNGTLVKDWRDYASLKSMIDAALASATKS
ncbi:MAG TPA: DsbA family protein [Dehalococcoidia bacterium]|nr:DsbA family protein [Dehalococcoidia bacterium]